MDYADPAADTAACDRHRAAVPRPAARSTTACACGTPATRVLVEVHLLFPFAITLGEAHRRATVLEQHLAAALGEEAEVVTHLESVEDHAGGARGRHIDWAGVCRAPVTA